MKSNDPYGIASHKAKVKKVKQRETQMEDTLSAMLKEMKSISESLSNSEKN